MAKKGCQEKPSHGAARKATEFKWRMGNARTPEEAERLKRIFAEGFEGFKVAVAESGKPTTSARK